MASSRSDGSRPSRLTMALNSSSVIPSRRCLGSTDASLTGGREYGRSAKPGGSGVSPREKFLCNERSALVYLFMRLQDVCYISSEKPGGVIIQKRQPVRAARASKTVGKRSKNQVSARAAASESKVPVKRKRSP